MNWDTFVQMAQQLFGLRLTLKETGDLFYALTTGAGQVCNTAYDNVETYLPQIIEAIRAQNPDVQILLLGCYNPVPLLWTWSNFFNRYNRFVRSLAEEDRLHLCGHPPHQVRQRRPPHHRRPQVHRRADRESHRAVTFPRPGVFDVRAVFFLPVAEARKNFGSFFRFFLTGRPVYAIISLAACAERPAPRKSPED